MNEDYEEGIIFDSKDSFICIKFEGGAYYFTVASGEVRGPFFEEAEAYQEALRELANFLGITLDILADIEDRARNIIRTVKGFDDADD